MAKRKNPLSDLDAFLKQEASSLVKPEGLKKEQPTANTETQEAPTKEKIVELLVALGESEGANFSDTLYYIIRETFDTLGTHSSEDKMLLNTVLYLKNKPNWKVSLEDYWSNQKH